MKKMPPILLIPMIAIMIVVAVAAAYKLLSPSSAMPAKAKEEYPNPLSKTQVSKPSSFLGGLLGGGQATPTPDAVSADDFANELKNTVDDGGSSELDALKTDASSL
jgi:hypothetical protein